MDLVNMSEPDVLVQDNYHGEADETGIGFGGVQPTKTILPGHYSGGSGGHSNGTVEIIPGLRFEFGSAELIRNPEIDRALQLMSERIGKPGCPTALLAGHTDITGSQDFNLALSKERAQAVQTILVYEFSVQRDFITVKGYGENHTLPNILGNHENNRRVEIVCFKP